MSRVGKKPIQVPDKIKIQYKDKVITVEGEKGFLTQTIHPDIDLKIEGGFVIVSTCSDNRSGRALHGMTRSLVSNMITGVNKGFERILEINGIGYRAELKDKSLIFNLGFSHPVVFDLPEGITAAVEKNTIIKLSGISKQQLGLAAATIRRLKPPESYKGKGIKYAEESIRKKAGKTGTK
ncbi:MAG: 50S ribosomal protein L6 [Desulfobacterium sp.]|nr:50S ribosomal protein L6 [Desulfobacterium sp.]MBU3947129.1 50S ribosomal protein L6 [Pseudomonadota bacterium]MBU4010867.1 50S ribosomal protein L6 [Pseudomonadota bacterium]MBU4037101.1 50S ribosomal protein L6 [Pseudomonadota bacterium]